MANSKNNAVPPVKPMLQWAKLCADIVEDLSRSILAFIPNGLNLIYDSVLKNVPVIGNFFKLRWVEQTVKLCTFIPIGQGLAIDLARFIFRPLGYLFGCLIGTSALTAKRTIPTYQGQIGKTAYRLSGQAIGGAVSGVFIYLFVAPFLGLSLHSVRGLCIASFTGMSFTLIAKTFFIFAMNAAEKANAATIRKNVQRAKELNSKLQVAAKQKAKSRILIHAQDIIQQMNGPQSQQDLEMFFKVKYEAIAISTNKQIERHFNFITDRACHGDLKALKRLQELIPTKHNTDPNSKNAFDVMLDRIFNPRSIFKLKDDVDTAYDRWHYEFLRAKAPQVLT